MAWRGMAWHAQVPKSHLRFEEMFNDEHAAVRGRGGYCPVDLAGDHERYCQGAVCVELDRGDMLLWDSRTIHCNQGRVKLHCKRTANERGVQRRT